MVSRKDVLLRRTNIKKVEKDNFQGGEHFYVMVEIYSIGQKGMT